MDNNHVFQEHEAYCGPAVAQMVLMRFGAAAAQQDIAKELETDFIVGTSAGELQKFFERRGFSVVRKNDAAWEDIEAQLSLGVVIVGYIEKLDEDPHYALVAALRSDTIVLRDPLHGDNFTLPKKEFLERWKDDAARQYGNRMLLVVMSRD